MNAASRFALAAVVLAPMLGAGCGLFQRQAPQPPALLIPQPPILLPSTQIEPPMPPPMELDPVADLAPVLVPVELGAPPPRRTAENGARAEARPAAADAPSSTATPQLTAALTPAQQDADRNATLAVLNRVQGELRTLYNRHDLNNQDAATRAQADEYVHQAQDALSQGDLVRAQNLANKADTLARFLLGR